MQYNTIQYRALESRVVGEGITVTIHVPIDGMGEIPEQLKKYNYEKIAFEYGHMNGNIHRDLWTGGNHDAGVYDALMVRHYHGTRVDIYVCAILRRPFTEDERDAYEKLFEHRLDVRLLRVFDNHFKPIR